MSHHHTLTELRHSAAHLLAHAILELYPKTILTIGPATAEGFFYDILPLESLRIDDLPLIHQKMQELVSRNLAITHEQISKTEARKLFAHNQFKLELINDIDGETVGLSRQGDFIDLCKGGHVSRTGLLKYTLLTGISGAYWRADKNNQALQRISGTAFFSPQELDDWVHQREEAAKYDHRKLGKQMDLFSFHQEGVGFPFFHPKGKTVINRMIDFLRKEQTAHGYQEISTPICLNKELWERSGHYEFYKDNMYFCSIDETEYAIKPMNCPGAFLLYNERPHSYRQLPLRLAEFGLVHRHELSGVLHGLMRARSFTIDDAHIICTIDQVEQEIITTITLLQRVLKAYGFESIKIGLSTKPENAMGSDEIWHKAESALKNALNSCTVPFVIQEGEGAFYGPKIEFKILDSLKREWQCGTIQVDFFMPTNFDLTYVSSEGTKERPVIIHRAIYGSLERFFAILLEHYKGRLPFWLAPVQITVLTITEAQQPYAQTIYQSLQQNGIRAIIDHGSDPISGKIKNAQLEQIPLMVIAGKKEAEKGTVTIRYADGSQKADISLSELIALVSGMNSV
ncbi:MAG: threonine--tRNA ligase [Candidatus Babeliales bacterium]